MENKAMYTLKLAAFSLLIISIVSEKTLEELAHEYCANECNREEWAKCEVKCLPKTLDFYTECAEKEREGKPATSDVDQFVCNETTTGQFSSIMDCYDKKLKSEYEDIYIGTITNCSVDAGCSKP